MKVTVKKIVKNNKSIDTCKKDNEKGLVDLLKSPTLLLLNAFAILLALCDLCFVLVAYYDIYNHYTQDFIYLLQLTFLLIPPLYFFYIYLKEIGFIKKKHISNKATKFLLIFFTITYILSFFVCLIFIEFDNATEERLFMFSIAFILGLVILGYLLALLKAIKIEKNINVILSFMSLIVSLIVLIISVT